MKPTIILTVSLISVIHCAPKPNLYFELVDRKIECLHYNGTCVRSCPEHMHAEHSRCQPTYSQQTCDEPRSRPLGIICDWSRCDCDFPCQPTYSLQTCDEPRSQPLGIICDWSRCDCDFPLVLHVTSGYCFLPEDCP